MVVLQSISFANYALTTTTTNIIYGSAPYLTFDGGRTRVTNTEALLGISLSDGRKFTPTTNNSSSTNPIELPVIGQSFNDIGMLIPTDTNSIALSSLIGTPYNYWGDDDGDGEGVNGITATGRLWLSIFDKDNNSVARNEVLTSCKAPYKLTISNNGGTLTTRYGIPNESRFEPRTATYYINPKESLAICFVHWDIYTYPTQSFKPSGYSSNFPTTGANNLYFELIIARTNQALSWAPVSYGGITATVGDSRYYSPTHIAVKVTLTGPVATPSQWSSDNPGQIDRPSLPQSFELVGRDSSGNAVVKYGFELNKWFVNRGGYTSNYYRMKSWCNSLGYRFVTARDLTDKVCYRDCHVNDRSVRQVGATPSSSQNFYARRGEGLLFTEWGDMPAYTGAAFSRGKYWVESNRGWNYYVSSGRGAYIAGSPSSASFGGVCVYP
ncbi:hypothetical protein B6D17_09780 [Gilliamella apis]|nr:hypothetical protein B6D17_09780 [Gilliamella apis]OTQ72778.1 hypothetical protein B6C90_10795 [Gilliamella apis]